jgi:hypothetical protein
MKPLARFSLLCGVLCLLIASMALTLYYLRLRSSYANLEFYEAFRVGILAPDSSPEKIREFALNAHKAIFVGYRALDAAVNLLVIVTFAAGGAFIYIFRSLKSQGSKSAVARHGS